MTHFHQYNPNVSANFETQLSVLRELLATLSSPTIQPNELKYVFQSIQQAAGRIVYEAGTTVIDRVAPNPTNWAQSQQLVASWLNRYHPQPQMHDPYFKDGARIQQGYVQQAPVGQPFYQQTMNHYQNGRKTTLDRTSSGWIIEEVKTANPWYPTSMVVVILDSEGRRTKETYGLINTQMGFGATKDQVCFCVRDLTSSDQPVQANLILSIFGLANDLHKLEQIKHSPNGFLVEGLIHAKAAIYQDLLAAAEVLKAKNNSESAQPAK